MHDVIIAGGGTVGLSAAVFLAHHGVRALVVERRSGPQIHPRATGLGMRTAELLREIGLEEAVNEVAVNMTGKALGKITVDTLAGTDLAVLAKTVPTRAQTVARMDYTPARIRGTCPQNRLEGVLLDKARELGVTVRYGADVVSVEQDDVAQDGIEQGSVEQGGKGVTVLLSDGTALRARYLIAADGARSKVRSELGIGLSGPGVLGSSMNNVLFRADLSGLTGAYTFGLCEITNPAAPGMIMTIDGKSEWVFHTGQEPTADLIRTAIGDPGLEVEILSVLAWRARAQVADRLSLGRVFLVGDAAHAVPPTGAFGLNTGVADAHNLAWKLAWVLSGRAAPGLLDTYHDERRPVAVLAMEQSLLRLRDLRLHFDGGPDAPRLRAEAGAVNAPIVHLGYRYGATIGELPSTEDVALTLDGSPGSRLPHVWVGDRSTLDLVGSTFCVFAAAPVTGLDVPVHVVDGWSYGTLLVRPDGFVAWRGEEGLAEALRRCTSGA